MAIDMVIGRRYQLEHGTGILIGLELNDPKREGHLMVSTDHEVVNGPLRQTRFRFVFAIDDCYWSDLMKSNCYAAWYSPSKDVQDIREMPYVTGRNLQKL